ncbi:MAG: magnesium transporter CorA family protein [Acidobacteriota bacterium]
MIRCYVHRAGKTERADRLDPAWLAPGSGAVVWADLSQPGPDEAAILSDTFGFHELAVEDALQAVQHPKVEHYADHLYIVLHGIDVQLAAHTIVTHDTDFFLGPTYLVTVHDGRRRSIAHVSEICERSGLVLAEGPVALLHRIVDTMVEHYRPEIEELEDRLDEIERRVLEGEASLTADLLAAKRDIAMLRRVLIPQRDVIARLSRREFDLIDQEMAYRFRDVHDQLVRLTDDLILFQERVTGILDAHLASVSNRLAQVSKMLAVIAALFGPLTVITGLYGMNIPLPDLPGSGTAEFWQVIGLMALASGGMLLWFRHAGLF